MPTRLLFAIASDDPEAVRHVLESGEVGAEEMEAVVHTPWRGCQPGQDCSDEAMGYPSGQAQAPKWHHCQTPPPSPDSAPSLLGETHA